MLIISQNRYKTTECMELEIKKRKTCKSVFIDKASFQKFKRITNKKDDEYISIEELKRFRGIDGKRPN